MKMEHYRIRDSALRWFESFLMKKSISYMNDHFYNDDTLSFNDLLLKAFCYYACQNLRLLATEKGEESYLLVL